ncbi:flagellar biosynthesis protein FlgA [Methylopila sp. Yamaguchi]|uniref:flagellar biosynthesis protein FlgA n=1 Tax=Methylopila sp. Yamaguchi TaxID=1437817 RepID=UPI000CA6D95D|nr:flagellar biosynthesis protein FlgA [Methylopila sp. Yamaguchi]GBD48366.1 SAF domain-containing protein [Methylopila sp. Yamaguchi]
MNSHRRFARAERPIEVALVGAGAFGRSLLAQGGRMKLMSVRVAIDVTAARAAEAFRATGADEGAIALCESRAEAAAAWEAGRLVAAGDLDVALGLPVDIVVEASGHPEAGAVHALASLEAGKHVALVTKETDSVVGAYLAAVAADRGLVCTPVDGDQPALLIGLVTWAETLGLPIISAGKASEYDFVFDPATERLTSEDRVAHAPGFGAAWDLGDRPVAEVVAERAAGAAALPQRAVPDLCEMAVVANATGLKPDVAPFHVPIARIQEVATVFEEQARGGLLSGGRRLDVFNCLRAPGEISFAGGVFVVVRCEDAETWAILAAKGHTMSRGGDAAMLWLPRHLLGVEAPISLLDAVVNGVSVGGTPTPVVDLVGRTTKPLPKGTLLEAEGHHHTIDGVGPELIDAAPLASERPAPYYLIAGRRLRRDLPAGASVTLGDLELDETAPLYVMRRRQDERFFGA